MNKVEPNNFEANNNMHDYSRKNLNKFKKDLDLFNDFIYHNDKMKDNDELIKLKKKIELETMRITATYVAHGVFDVGLLFGIINIFSKEEFSNNVKIVLVVGFIIYNIVAVVLAKKDIDKLNELSDQEDELYRKLKK